MKKRQKIIGIILAVAVLICSLCINAMADYDVEVINDGNTVYMNGEPFLCVAALQIEGNYVYASAEIEVDSNNASPNASAIVNVYTYIFAYTTGYGLESADSSIQERTVNESRIALNSVNHYLSHSATYDYVANESFFINSEDDGENSCVGASTSNYYPLTRGSNGNGMAVDLTFLPGIDF